MSKISNIEASNLINNLNETVVEFLLYFNYKTTLENNQEDIIIGFKEKKFDLLDTSVKSFNNINQILKDESIITSYDLADFKTLNQTPYSLNKSLKVTIHLESNKNESIEYYKQYLNYVFSDIDNLVNIEIIKFLENNKKINNNITGIKNSNIEKIKEKFKAKEKEEKEEIIEDKYKYLNNLLNPKDIFYYQLMTKAYTGIKIEDKKNTESNKNEFDNKELEELSIEDFIYEINKIEDKNQLKSIFNSLNNYVKKEIISNKLQNKSNHIVDIDYNNYNRDLSNDSRNKKTVYLLNSLFKDDLAYIQKECSYKDLANKKFFIVKANKHSNMYAFLNILETKHKELLNDIKVIKEIEKLFLNEHRIEVNSSQNFLSKMKTNFSISKKEFINFINTFKHLNNSLTLDVKNDIYNIYIPLLKNPEIITDFIKNIDKIYYTLNGEILENRQEEIKDLLKNLEVQTKEKELILANQNIKNVINQGNIINYKYNNINLAYIPFREVYTKQIPIEHNELQIELKEEHKNALNNYIKNKLDKYNKQFIFNNEDFSSEKLFIIKNNESLTQEELKLLDKSRVLLEKFISHQAFLDFINISDKNKELVEIFPVDEIDKLNELFNEKLILIESSLLIHNKFKNFNNNFKKLVIYQNKEIGSKIRNSFHFYQKVKGYEDVNSKLYYLNYKGKRIINDKIIFFENNFLTNESLSQLKEISLIENNKFIETKAALFYKLFIDFKKEIDNNNLKIVLDDKKHEDIIINYKQLNNEKKNPTKYAQLYYQITKAILNQYLNIDLISQYSKLEQEMIIKEKILTEIQTKIELIINITKFSYKNYDIKENKVKLANETQLLKQNASPFYQGKILIQAENISDIFDFLKEFKLTKDISEQVLEKFKQENIVTPILDVYLKYPQHINIKENNQNIIFNIPFKTDYKDSLEYLENIFSKGAIYSIANKKRYLASVYKDKKYFNQINELDDYLECSIIRKYLSNKSLLFILKDSILTRKEVFFNDKLSNSFDIYQTYNNYAKLLGQKSLFDSPNHDHRIKHLLKGTSRSTNQFYLKELIKLSDIDSILIYDPYLNSDKQGAYMPSEFHLNIANLIKSYKNILPREINVQFYSNVSEINKYLRNR